MTSVHRTLTIENLAENVTENDILHLFGLDTTNMLHNTTTLQIASVNKNGVQERVAHVAVIHPMQEELLKFNDYEFFGRRLTITDDSTTVDVDNICHMEIDTRRPEWLE